MHPSQLMRGAPPAPEAQVTLANWRSAPYSSWAFRNVRRLLPTEALPQCGGGRPFPVEGRDFSALSVPGLDGQPAPLTEALQSTYTDSFLVLHQGRLVYEWYDRGLSAEQPHIIFSVTKSVTGSLAGILVDRGLLDPEAPIIELLPEVEGSAYGTATVRQLLDMTISTNFVEDYENPTEEYLRYRVSTGWNPSPEANRHDMRGFLATLSLSDQPHGAAFHYVSPNSDLLGWVLERASGTSYAELLAREIWQPMGAEGEAYITVDRLGAPRTAGGLCVTPRDLLRFGEVMRLRGTLNGKQILPGWWVDDIRQAGDRGAWQRGNFAEFLPEGRYRSKWYQLGDAGGSFCGIGIHGQWLFVDPENEAVYVKTSAHPVASNDGADRVIVGSFRAVGAALAG